MKIRTFLSNIFSVRYIDSHYIVILLGIHIRLKCRRNFVCPVVTEIGISEDKNKIGPKLIVSMTSFPERMLAASEVIRTLLSQTIKPDMVILWLAETQFPKKENDIPVEILDLQKYGLSIRWYHDIRSYKKLIPALLLYPNDIIVTFDDDFYYAPDTIESLYNSYLMHPNEVHAHRCGRIKISNGELKNTRSALMYDEEYSNPSYFNRLTGNAGVLYPPNIFHKDILKEDIFLKLLPTHDDVYFWAMATLNGAKTRIVKGYSESIHYIDNTQHCGLCRINKENSFGIPINEAYRKIIKRYPQIKDILVSERDSSI